MTQLEPAFDKLGWKYKTTRKGYLLNCPFAPFTHSSKKDSHPSCAVWPEIDYWRCYSCGQKGTLKELFEKFHQFGGELINIEFLPIMDETPPPSLLELSPNALDPFPQKVQYITTSPLWQERQFDPRLIQHFDLRCNRDYLIFPVRGQQKQLYGAVGRSFRGKKLHNFFHFPTGLTLGGLDKLTENRKIAVVEGMTCLLKCYFWAQELGFDVVCCWTANVTSEQARLLMDTGKVIHCWFDQDKAGDNAWKKLESECKFNFGLTRHKWPQLNDIGSFTKEQFFKFFGEQKWVS